MIYNLSEGSAKSINYDNTESGLAATNVQDAIDETISKGVKMRDLDYSGTVLTALAGTTGTETDTKTATKDGVLYITLRSTSSLTAEVLVANAGSNEFTQVAYTSNNAATSGLEHNVNRQLPIKAGMKYKAKRSATNGGVLVYIHFIPYAD